MFDGSSEDRVLQRIMGKISFLHLSKRKDEILRGEEDE